MDNTSSSEADDSLKQSTICVLSLLKHVSLDSSESNESASSSNNGKEEQEGDCGYGTLLVDTLQWMQSHQLKFDCFDEFSNMVAWLQERCSLDNRDKGDNLNQLLLMHPRLPMAAILDTYCYFSRKTSNARKSSDRLPLDNLMSFLMCETMLGNDLYTNYLSTVN